MVAISLAWETEWLTTDGWGIVVKRAVDLAGALVGLRCWRR